MTPARQIIVAALLLFVAAVLQGTLAHAVAIRNAEPDFTIVVLACGALLIDAEEAVVGLSMLTGLMLASMNAQYVGSYLTSRLMAGVFAGSLQRHLIRDNLVVPPLVVVVATLLSELIFAAMVPGVWLHHLRPWAREKAGELAYNAVLSFPVYALMRRFGIGYRREDPFG